MKIRDIRQCFFVKKQLLSRIRYVMKISVVLLTGVFLSISTMAFPQRVTVKLKNAPLKDFFETLQKQVDVALLFSENIVNHKRISINEKDIQLKDLLERELPKHQLDFKEFNGQITIVPSSKKTIKKESIKSTVDVQENITIKGRVFNI